MAQRKTAALRSDSDVAGMSLPAHAEKFDAELRQRIQERAYQLWEADGRPAGREESHWLAAEREILGQGLAKARKPGRSKAASGGSGAAKKAPAKRSTAPSTGRAKPKA